MIQLQEDPGIFTDTCIAFVSAISRFDKEEKRKWGALLTKSRDVRAMANFLLRLTLYSLGYGHTSLPTTYELQLSESLV
jgi:hypothetical protein